jgi:hypothetical protein
VKKIQEEKGHLVFADEAIFTSKGFSMLAWAGPSNNVLVEDRGGKQVCQAVCAAVCPCHELLTFAIEEFSFDGPKFISFCKQIRDACGDEKVYLFLDNSSVHRSVSKQLAELNILPVWNLPYAPEYNSGVERYWAQLKAYFRPLLLSKMVKGPKAKDTPLLDALKQTIKDVRTTSIPAFCASGLEKLSYDAAKIRQERKLLPVSYHQSDESPKK